MPKKKLLILTGAGASIDFGMPSVSKCDRIFAEKTLRLLPLVSEPTQSLYSFIKNKVSQYYSNISKGIPKQTNFEELLYTINILSTVLGDDLHHKYPLRALLNPIDLPEVLEFNKHKIPDGHTFNMLHHNLVDKLLYEIRKSCIDMPTLKSDELKILKKFLSDLKDEFDIAIITVNYDDVFLQADSSFDTGFDRSGQFQPSNVTNNNWNFCYHLHGSVHFNMQDGSTNLLHEIMWKDNLNSPFSQNSAGRNSISTMEGLQLPTSSIIAGYDKSNQIQRYPFKTYYSQLEEILHETDALLICGYGFSDFHLNNQLQTFRNYGGSTKKVVVIDYANDNEDPFAFRGDEHSRNMSNTLIIDGGKMGTRGHAVPPAVEDLKKDKIFEYSHNPNFPLSIWYNGFLEACKNGSKVISELTNP